MYEQDTILAVATGSGSAAISVIRLSGKDAVSLVDQFFHSKSGKQFIDQKSHTLHFGSIENHGEVIDEVLVSLFKNPKSYTGEDVVEISCHGSVYIQTEILSLFINHGARLANPGEFTLRAFLNGKLDLSQAEAVADLIASESKIEHEIAMQQMRGGFSSEIANLRDQLIHFAAMLELELDFTEEDVEFANRKELLQLTQKLKHSILPLIDSFGYGNVIKTGVPVAIVGKPNAGKSSLLNAILKENKAIVSNIPGTTRDTIEDTIVIKGVKFRFIDTAGLRKAGDEIEAIGIERAKEKIQEAKILIYLFEKETSTIEDIQRDVQLFTRNDLILQLVENKIDLYTSEGSKNWLSDLAKVYESDSVTRLSTFDTNSVMKLVESLFDKFQKTQSNLSTIVSNTRHKNALQKCYTVLLNIESGVHSHLSGELLAFEVRDALQHLGEITGEIEIDRDILGTIFSNFCIGK